MTRAINVIDSLEQKIASLVDMIDNCADVPRNPDSLPMRVLHELRQMSSDLRSGALIPTEWVDGAGEDQIERAAKAMFEANGGKSRSHMLNEYQNEARDDQNMARYRKLAKAALDAIPRFDLSQRQKQILGEEGYNIGAGSLSHPLRGPITPPTSDTPVSAERVDGAGWRSDMENAPRDGTPCLLRCELDGEFFTVGSWFESEEFGGYGWTDFTVANWDMQEYRELQPTHWMSLPAPPTSDANPT